MARRMLSLVVLLTLAAAGGGVVGLAEPAQAAPVIVGLGPQPTGPCNAEITVVPYAPLTWIDGEGFWVEGANITGSGTCQTASGPKSLTFIGDWDRAGKPRDATGVCPLAKATFTRIRLGGRPWYPGDYDFGFLGWSELTPETSASQSYQVVSASLGLGVAQTDVAACAAWPTVAGPPSSTLPTPAAFHISTEWDLSTPSPLVRLCVTVQGVLPRLCPLF